MYLLPLQMLMPLMSFCLLWTGRDRWDSHKCRRWRLCRSPRLPHAVKDWSRWISWIWFCLIDLSEDLLLNKDLRYLVVLQLSFRNPLLQELLLNGTHYQIPSPHWLRYHLSEAICLLHYACRRAHSIAEISVRRLAIIIQIQVDSATVIHSRNTACVQNEDNSD